MPGLAIIAGDGGLPRLVAEAASGRGQTYRVVLFGDDPPEWAAGHPRIMARFEGFGALFDAMHAAGLDQVVFVGGMARPNPDPAAFDAKTHEIAPRLLGSIGQGDDATLRVIAAIFEAEGFSVQAAHDLLPGLLAGPGPLGACAPSPADLADLARAGRIVAALGAADVGQGAVVAQGICLGAESIQGTDMMLEFVARTASRFRPDVNGARGVLFKGPKPGQDLRLDLPAIGPLTVANAARAGLAGIGFQAGGVLILERPETIAAADSAGLFLFGVRQDG